MRSLLFVPANSERKINKALISGADVVILDLEDSVAPNEKPAARELALSFLNNRDSASPLLYVRVNPLSTGLTQLDLDAVLSGRPDGIMQPKTEHGRDVATLSQMIGDDTPIIAIATETAKSMFTLGTYDEAGPNLAGLTWGAEDLSSDIGALDNKTETGELAEPYRLARTLALLGARAAEVEPIDTVNVAFRDTEALVKECAAAARDGFTGKMAIHPDQVPVINEAFTPSAAQVAEAQAVIDAFGKAGDAGVVAIEGAMYDIPHLKRSKRLLARAQKLAGT